jgi:hypothetical protein
MSDASSVLSNPSSLSTQATDALQRGPAPKDDALSQVPTSPHFDAAMSEMKLNNQEQFLYQTHLRNLAGGGVANPAGGTSSLFAATFDVDGRTYVIPTVWNGQIVPPGQAMELARQIGLDKFPSYDSAEAAMQRYNQMHGFMEKDTTGAGH